MPNKECEHCVLRARYESHKAGEQTFYQCADITIKKSEDDVSRSRDPDTALLQHAEYEKAYKKYNVITQGTGNDVNYDVSLRGFAYSPFDQDVMFIVNVTLDGRIHPFGKFSFRVDSANKYRSGREKEATRKPLASGFVLDSLVTVNYWNNLVVMYNSEGDYDKPTPMLAEFDTHQGTMQTSEIADFDGSPINALLSNLNDTYYTFSIENAGSKGHPQINTLPPLLKKKITEKCIFFKNSMFLHGNLMFAFSFVFRL